MRVGASDSALTPTAGLVAVTELCDRLRLIESIDQAAGPIKQRNRGHGLGELLVGMAAAQLAGEDFLVGLDRQRADAAGQVLAPVPGLAASTAVGLARRVTPGQWAAVETGLAQVDVERVDYPEDESMRISHEGIYQALYVQGRGALPRELTACLRTGRALRVPRARARRRGKNFITEKVMISQRPAEVADRAVPGHWEGDLERHEAPWNRVEVEDLHRCAVVAV